jgi:hypothetical protein
MSLLPTLLQNQVIVAKKFKEEIESHHNADQARCQAEQGGIDS